MKQICAFTFVFLSLFFMQCGPSAQDAINYNDKLISEQVSATDAINAVESAFATYDPAEIEIAMNNAKKQVKKSIAEVEKIGDFDGNSEFKDSVLDLLQLFQKQLNAEYAEQLELYKLTDDKYTEKEENLYNELSKQINEDYEKVFNKFTIVQREFADKWRIDLE